MIKPVFNLLFYMNCILFTNFEWVYSCNYCDNSL